MKPENNNLIRALANAGYAPEEIERCRKPWTDRPVREHEKRRERRA